MNFLTLEYFLIAAEELNFTRAANRLFITQQTLSSHILKLEQELGTALFNRTPPMSLTTAGYCLVNHASSILNERKLITQDINNIKNNYSGHLTISIVRERAAFMLPKPLAAFHAKFPNIALYILEGATSQEVEDSMYRGDADLCIGLQITENPAIVSQILTMEKAVIVVPNSILYKYFTQCGQEIPDPNVPVKLSVFSKCPFVAFSQDTWFGSNFAKQCKNENFTPYIVSKASTTTTVLSLCYAGLGVSLCPKSMIDVKSLPLSPLALESVTLYELDDNRYEYTIAVNYFKKKAEASILKQFVEFFSNYYSQQ